MTTLQAASIISTLMRLFPLGMLLTGPALHSQTVTGAVCRADGSVQIVYAHRKIMHQPKEPSQVGCADTTIAPDRHTVGWSVLVPNCCSSYPIPIAVVVLRHGRKRVFQNEQMVWQWDFVGGGQSVAVLSGPVHGQAGMASLFDTQSGRRIATWNGSGDPPTWASAWRQNFGPS